MQRVDVGERGGMVTLEVEVGDRKVVALLSPEGLEVVMAKMRVAQARARERRRLEREGPPTIQACVSGVHDVGEWVDYTDDNGVVWRGQVTRTIAAAPTFGKRAYSMVALRKIKEWS